MLKCDYCDTELEVGAEECTSCNHKVIADITLKADTLKVDEAISRILAVVKSDIFNCSDSYQAEYALQPSTCEVTEAPKGENLTANNPKVSVVITPEESQKSSLSLATVQIDSKWYDLGILEAPIELYMNQNHVIKIYWTENDIETFEFIRKG